MEERGATPIRVLLCEDSLGFRMLASAWLDDAADMELIGVAETGEEAVNLATQLRPDVVLLDHLLPDADSSTLVERLREVAPGVAIALVSGMPNDLLATEAERASVEAFCSKASEPSGFLTVVRDAYAVSEHQPARPGVRRLPVEGAEVTVVYLGTDEPGVIATVAEAGRVVEVATLTGERLTFRLNATGWFVTADRSARLQLRPD